MEPIIGNITVWEFIVGVLTYLGVPWLSVRILEWLQREDTPTQLQLLSFGWKRVLSVAVAVIMVTGLWLFAMWGGAYPVPAGDVRAWFNAWFMIAIPAGVIQQFVHGFTK